MDHLYVERASGFIFEVKLFEEFVMLRPATPGFERQVSRLSHGEFADRFDELLADPSPIWAMLAEFDTPPDENGIISTERKDGDG